LFTLVGIAGEDDLDAPDLCDGSPSPRSSVLDRSWDDQCGISRQTPDNGRDRGNINRQRSAILEPDQSAELRGKLLLEMAGIPSADLSAWAREALATKNSLTASDAKLVEDAFERRLAEPLSSEIVWNGRSSETQAIGPQETVCTESTNAGRALCRLASGGSFAVRQLYTDDDEVLFQAARPLLVNGIEEVITRPDLADRAIFLTLPPVADDRRQTERELWREFERARPRIIGALLDLVVHGLRTLPGTVDRLPRMADFALWAAACETALWPSGTFGRGYETNRQAAMKCIIDADPVAACVREIMAERSSWTGSAADLLRAGAGRGSDGVSRDGGGWPAGTGHRHYVQSRRPSGKQDHPDACYYRKYRQHE
jgi:hypothetical protein